MSSLWEIFGIFSITVLSPFVSATESVQLPLPQNTNYAHYIRSQIMKNPFSIDPLEMRGMVASETTGSADIQAYIINYKECIILDDIQTYKLFVRNNGDGPAENATVIFTYPIGIMEYQWALPPPSPDPDPLSGTILWELGRLNPGEGRELLVTFFVKGQVDKINTEMTVQMAGFSTITRHSVPSCLLPTSFPRQELPAGKQPAIICDPGERSCNETIGQLTPKLGFNFKRAVNDPSLVPTVCSPNDPDPLGCDNNIPELGVRFAEAVADILPGDCRVLDDAIISSPDYQDAFNRRAKPSAVYMLPLYNSAQDFKKLVHGNDLSGIPFFMDTKKTLSAIHTKNWNIQAEDIKKVLKEEIPAGDVRSRVDAYHQNWQQETRGAQTTIKPEYEALQSLRKEKFNPVGEKAIENAKQAIDDTCGLADNDGNLQLSLFDRANSVKKLYEDSLNNRQNVFDETQSNFVNPPPGLIPDENLAQTWQNELRQALDEFDNGNRVPLEKYLASIPTRDRIGFSVGWENTYKKHSLADQDADEVIRLDQWEVALELPKSIITSCEMAHILAAPVEITWCESGQYEEFIVRGSPLLAKKARKFILPPIDMSQSGYDTVIDPQRVVGLSCGARPGDPFWSYDCSCSCNELVPRFEGNIRFCQASPPSEEEEGGQDTNNQQEEEEEPPILPIIRHDSDPITSKEECLLETERHTQPNPEDVRRIRF